MKAAKSSLPELCRGVAAAALVALACAGCASRAAVTDSGRLPNGAVDTGTYPNLNVPPPVATQTFDKNSLQAHNKAIGEARDGQKEEGKDAAELAAQGRAEQARLRDLAKSQQAETLKAITAPSNQGVLQRARASQAEQARQANAAAAARRAGQERARQLGEAGRAAAKEQGAAPNQKARDAALQGARAKQAEAAKSVTATDGLSPAERERLRKLAAAKQAETLKAIEKAD